MAHICHITALDDEHIKVYARLTEVQLRNELHPEDGVFIAESPKVMRRTSLRVAETSTSLPDRVSCWLS